MSSFSSRQRLHFTFIYGVFFLNSVNFPGLYYYRRKQQLPFYDILKVDVITLGDLKRKAMKFNANKTKQKVLEREERMTDYNILIEGKKMEQLKEFVHPT